MKCSIPVGSAHPGLGPSRWAGLMVVLVLGGVPRASWANAGGVVERDEEYFFNDQLFLRLLTGDACEPAEVCFHLTRVAERPALLHSIFGDRVRALDSRPLLWGKLIWRIADPAPPAKSVVFAQSTSDDGGWAVFDAATEKVLVGPHLRNRRSGGAAPLRDRALAPRAGATGALFLSPVLVPALVIAGVLRYRWRRRLARSVA